MSGCVVRVSYHESLTCTESCSVKRGSRAISSRTSASMVGQVTSRPSSTTSVKRNQASARSSDTIDLATFDAGGCVRTSVGYLSFELTSTCEHFCKHTLLILIHECVLAASPL